MEKTDREKISIVVPCRNEEDCVRLFYGALIKTLRELPVDYEVIFVDDGSTDRTLELFRELAASDDRVRYLSLSRNFGKEGAIYAGLKAATGDYIGLMDADMQDPPELLKEMYRGIKEEGYDCVGSRRISRTGEPRVRSFFAKRFYKLINRLSDTEIVDGARDYRLMTRKMTDAVLSMSEVDRFSKGLFGWVGFRTKWLEYKNADRAAGKTKWSFGKLVKYAVEGIEDFSTAPMKLNFLFSFLCFLAGIGFVVADVVFLALGRDVSAFFALSPLLLFVGAAVLLGLGITGEYVAKIFRQAKNRPVCLVRETEKDLRADSAKPGEKSGEEEPCGSSGTSEKAS